MKSGLKEKIFRLKWKDLPHCFIFLLALPCSYFFRHCRPALWLFCEYENEARDNAYWLFKYTREHHPEQDAVYAINKKSIDYKKIEPVGECVQYGSFKHWIYYLSAQVNISSQKGGKPNAALCYFLEVNKILRNRRVFIQHGVVMNALPYLYKKNAQLTMLTCTCDREYKFILETFGYPTEAVKKTGLCRFDALPTVPTETPERIILIASSWRQTLTGLSAEAFQKSGFFNSWSMVLQEHYLGKLLERYDCKLFFYLHRELHAHENSFQVSNKRIEILHNQENAIGTYLKKASLLISDYSSVTIDFAYMNKPLLYYQPDAKQFFTEHLGKGYFNYELDGFGKVCRNLTSLLTMLEKLLSRNFMVEKLYSQRRDNFFSFYDQQNCERVYQAITTLKRSKSV